MGGVFFWFPTIFSEENTILLFNKNTFVKRGYPASSAAIAPIPTFIFSI